VLRDPLQCYSSHTAPPPQKCFANVEIGLSRTTKLMPSFSSGSSQWVAELAPQAASPNYLLVLHTLGQDYNQINVVMFIKQNEGIPRMPVSSSMSNTAWVARSAWADVDAARGIPHCIETHPSLGLCLFCRPVFIELAHLPRRCCMMVLLFGLIILGEKCDHARNANC